LVEKRDRRENEVGPHIEPLIRGRKRGTRGERARLTPALADARTEKTWGKTGRKRERISPADF